MTTCDDCKDEIALTDVQGHYDGKCAICRIRQKTDHRNLIHQMREDEEGEPRDNSGDNDQSWRGNTGI